jgi:serine/threonine-protein kinase RsbW
MRAARVFSDESPQPPGVTLWVPVALSSLPVIGARLHAFALAGAGPIGDAKEVHDLRLAVQEACTNVIKHSRNMGDRRRMAVRFELWDDYLTVYITDQGDPFDPRRTVVLPGRPEDLSEGGYGLFLIQALVDELRYEATECGNTVVLSKRLPVGNES